MEGYDSNRYFPQSVDELYPGGRDGDPSVFSLLVSSSLGFWIVIGKSLL